MIEVHLKQLSKEGREFLADPELYETLANIVGALGVTPEEYLLRFEEVLKIDPNAVLSIFEK